MEDEWKLISLDQLYEFSSGLSKPRSEFGDGYPFLSFKDVFHNTFVPKTLTERVRSSESERQRLSIRRGDVFLTRTSETVDELGMSCVALADIPNATFNGFTKRLRPRSTDIVVPEYAGYFFRGPRFRSAVYAMSSLSTRASLNEEMLARLSITVPPVNVQIAIGRILKSLDDKIELNRRMNETLEAIARALFKSWFVDFDPAQAKTEGHDPGVSPHLAALFPHSFEDSEIGEIPKGWALGTINDLANVSSGKRPDVRFAEPSAQANVPLWGGNGPMAFVPLALVDRPILLTGRVGTLGSVFRITTPCWPSDNTLLIEARKPEAFEYLFLQLKRIDIAALNRGSTQPLLTQTDLKSLPVPLPPASVLERFHEFSKGLYERIDSSERESRTLAALRDALLPKLISGDLHVKDAELFLEECAHEARSPPSTGEGMRLPVA
jgi:type I restriction enzyme S subunit